MDDLKLISGVVIFGGMALLLIIMVSLYLYARNKRLKEERFREDKYGRKDIVNISYTR